MFMERSYNFINVWYTTSRDNVLRTAFSERHKIILFTFMHLADAFIQSDLQCIQVIHIYQYVCFLGIRFKFLQFKTTVSILTF